MDLSAFGDSSFNPKSFVNALLEESDKTSEPQLSNDVKRSSKTEEKIALLLLKMQLSFTEFLSSFEQSAASALEQIPISVMNMEKNKVNLDTLSQQIIVEQENISTSLADSSSLSVLSELEKQRSFIAEAVSALRNAQTVTDLLDKANTSFRQKDLVQLTRIISSLKSCSTKYLPSQLVEEIESSIRKYSNETQLTLNDELFRALEGSDQTKTRTIAQIYYDLGLEEKVISLYSVTRHNSFKTIWKNIEDKETKLEFFDAFFQRALQFATSELSWCSSVFNPSTKHLYILKLFTNSFISMNSEIMETAKSAISSSPVEMLLKIVEMFSFFISSIESLISEETSVEDLNDFLEFSRSVLLPLSPLIDNYPLLELQILKNHSSIGKEFCSLQHTHTVNCYNHFLTFLQHRTRIIFAELSLPFAHCLHVCCGRVVPRLAGFVQDFLTELHRHFQTFVQSLRNQSLNLPFNSRSQSHSNSLTNDGEGKEELWEYVAVLRGVHKLTSTIENRIALLVRDVISTIDVAMRVSSKKLNDGSIILRYKASPTVLYALCSQNVQKNFDVFQKNLNDPTASFSLFHEPVHRFASLCEHINIYSHEVILEKCKRIISELPKLSVWVSEGYESELLSPNETVTVVSDLLFSIPQKLEHITENDEESSKLAASWLQKIAKSTQTFFIKTYAEIPSFTFRGVRQLLVDTTYLQSVFTSLGIENDVNFEVLKNSLEIITNDLSPQSALQKEINSTVPNLLVNSVLKRMNL